MGREHVKKSRILSRIVEDHGLSLVARRSRRINLRATGLAASRTRVLGLHPSDDCPVSAFVAGIL